VSCTRLVVFVIPNPWDIGTARILAAMGFKALATTSAGAGFGDTEFYPTLVEKAAVLCWHLTKNHPLPDANKRAAFTSMVAFLRRNGGRWQVPDEDDAVSAHTYQAGHPAQQTAVGVTQPLGGPYEP
jgi:hypothetical protein